MLGYSQHLEFLEGRERAGMQEHPFAQYLRALGKGPKLFRDLEEDEAEAAMAMVLRGDVDPIQLGAFLLLLRRKGETGAELAGFVRAAQSVLARPDDTIVPDLDWPSYADRHRQQPWFVLSALLLAANGVKVLMHGIDGGSEGYAPTPAALEKLGIHPCASLNEAAQNLRASNFAYIRLQDFCPELERLFQLRPLLGVRTAVNTFARDINPLDAPAQIQSVFHPPYRPLHQEIAIRLGQPRAAIFKGIGGEAQRSPMKECTVALVPGRRNRRGAVAAALHRAAGGNLPVARGGSGPPLPRHAVGRRTGQPGGGKRRDRDGGRGAEGPGPGVLDR